MSTLHLPLRVHRSLLSLAFAVIAATFGAAQEDSKADSTHSDLRAKVQSLVEELDAPQLARRNAAETSLQELGPEVTEFLPGEETSLSPEVAQRLARIRSRIAKLAATKAVQKNVGDVRLGAAATLHDALEAISRDSGIEFEHQADPSTTIQPYASALPFWHAVDYVLDQANLDIDFYASEADTLNLRSRMPNRPSRVDSAAYAGIYRLEPTIVTSRRVLTDVTLSGMNVELDVSWKPDTHPVGITLPLNQIVARLDSGDSIRAQETDGTIDIAPSADMATSSIQLPLVLPANRPTKIQWLSGQIKSMLPGEEKSFEFELKSGPQSVSKDFVTVRLEEIRKNGPLHELRLGIEYRSPGKAMESHRGWLLANPIHVELDDGSKEEHLGFELYRHNESGIGVGYLFDIGENLGDAKLVYRTPTAVIEESIEFVIQDVPLP